MTFPAVETPNLSDADFAWQPWINDPGFDAFGRIDREKRRLECLIKLSMNTDSITGLLSKCYLRDAPSAKGWFYHAGCFSSLDWSKQESEDDYLNYLSCFGHEKFHYLQYIGTTFGHFLADLQDIWIADVIRTVQFAISRSSTATSPLWLWSLVETDEELRERLARSFFIHNLCHKLVDLSIEGGLADEFDEFSNLYQSAFNWQRSAHRPKWFVSTDIFLDHTDLNFDGGGWFGARQIMEAAAWIYQLITTVNQPSKIPDGFPVDMARKLQNADRDPSLNRLGQAASTYIEAFTAIREYLPNDDHHALLTFLVLADLALMSPIGRYHSTCVKPPNLTDLLPGFRLLKAAQAAKRLNMFIEDIEHDYQPFMDALCVDLEIHWPQPVWLAIKADKLCVPCEWPSSEVILQWQLRAASIRRNLPHVFALPRAPLLDELRVPIVFLRDHIKVGCSSEEQTSLMSYFFRVLCADIWINGSRAYEGYQNVPELNNHLSVAFNNLFGIPLKGVLR